MRSSNPYNYNLPPGPEMFFGRRHDLDVLANALLSRPGDSVALIGGRRTGKTTIVEAFLRECEDRARESDWFLVPVFLDLSGEGVCSAGQFFRLVAEQVGVKLADHGIDAWPSGCSAPNDQSPPAPIFRGLMEVWGRAVLMQTGHSMRLVLLLDECEQIVEQPVTGAALRSLLVGPTTRNLFKVLMVGSHRFLARVRQRGSPLRNVLKYHTLGILDDAAIHELIVRPTEGILSDALVQIICRQSGGHPFLTQYLMHELWEGGIAGTSEEAIKRVAMAFPHERNDFSDWVEDLGASALQIYHMLVDCGGPLTERQLRERLQPIPMNPIQALDALCYHGLVVCGMNDQCYRIAGEMFRDWFVLNVSTDQEAGATARGGVTPNAAGSSLTINVRDGDVVIGSKPVGADQRDQVIHGPQTNIAGNATGPVLSGEFQSSVQIPLNAGKEPK